MRFASQKNDIYMMDDTANCKTCKALVWKDDVPNKKTGNCWKCEIKKLQDEKGRLEIECARLTSENERLDKARCGTVDAYFKTIKRLKVIAFYFDDPNVREAIEAWLEWSEDGIDWVDPPEKVDNCLSRLEKIE